MPLPEWYREALTGADKLASPSTPAIAPKLVKNHEQPTAPLQVVSAYIRSSKPETGTEKMVTSANTAPYYVIIGCGFSAVVNHSMLLRDRGKKYRINGRKVLHIGFRDPWVGYRDHEMNQEREVLSHPSFRTTLEEGNVNYEEALHKGAAARGTPFIRSSQFSAATAAEFKLVEAATNKAEPFTLRGVVTAIDKQEDKFVVVLDDNTKIKADYIDICVGPGQSRILEDTGAYGLLLTPSLRSEYENPGNDEAAPRFPRVVAGSEYTRANMQTKPGSAVFVQGAGPAAGQAVEEAFRMGAREVLWLAGDGIARAFTPNCRIDFLVKLENGANPPQPRMEYPMKHKFLPRIAGLTVAEGYRAKEIKELEDGRIVVCFEKKGNAQALRDVNGDVRSEKSSTPAGLTFGVFDQAIIAQGREDNQKTPGSPAYLVKLLSDAGMELDPILEEEMAVGMKTGKGRIRFLGAAGVSGKSGRDPLLGILDSHGFKKLTAYESSLPAQSRVFYQGVTLSAATIAFCNGHYPKHDMENVNTARRVDLINWLLDGSLYNAVYHMRALRTRPFKNTKQLIGAVVYYRRFFETAYNQFLNTLPEAAPLDPKVIEAINDNEKLEELGNAPGTSVSASELKALEKVALCYQDPGPY